MATPKEYGRVEYSPRREAWTVISYGTGPRGGDVETEVGQYWTRDDAVSHLRRIVDEARLARKGAR